MILPCRRWSWKQQRLEKKYVKPFATATFQEIGEYLDQHKNGEINLYEKWSIGDKKQIEIAEIDRAKLGSATFPASTVEIVLVDQNVYDLSDGSGKNIFVWNLYTPYPSTAYTNGGGTRMNTGTMADGNTGGWDACARRAWCNNNFYNALPADFRSLIKQVKVLTWASNNVDSGDLVASDDYCFLHSAYEITGSTQYTSFGEGSGRLKLYENDNAYLKKAGWFDPNNNYYIRTRSPYTDNKNSFIALSWREVNGGYMDHMPTDGYGANGSNRSALLIGGCI